MLRPPPDRRAVAGLAALALLLAGCTSGGEDPGPGTPSPAAEPTPLAEYGAAGVSLARTSACSALAEEGVARALGGEVTGNTSYVSGERARLAAGVRDVAHESGCLFRGAGRTTARAWTFAPPVSVPRARAVVRALAREQGCRRVAEAPPFGQPGIGRTCVRGKRVVGSYGGLFGEAWLGCSVAVPRSAARGEQGRAALVRRTGEWCVPVLQAARQVTEAAEAEQPEGSEEESGS